MSGPTLTAEQREALADVMLDAWDDEPSAAEEELVGVMVNVIAPVVASMLADAAREAEAKIELLRLITNVNGDWNVKFGEVETQRDAARAELDALRARIEALADKWLADRAGYPLDDPRASIAFITLKLCDEELSGVLDADS